MTAPEPAGPRAAPEADPGRDYDGPELRSGTPEYQAGYDEYRAWAGQAGPENEPVPYALTGQAEAVLAEPEPELDAEAEAEWADEWDSADSHAYMDRVEAGLEPEAEP